MRDEGLLEFIKIHSNSKDEFILTFFSLLIKGRTQIATKIADTATSTGSTGIGQTSVLMSFKPWNSVYTPNTEKIPNASVLSSPSGVLLFSR